MKILSNLTSLFKTNTTQLSYQKSLKYIQIDNEKIPEETCKVLNSINSTLLHYAQIKNIKITISGILDNLNQKLPHSDDSKFLRISIKDLKNKKNIYPEALINSDSKYMYTHITKENRIFNVPQKNNMQVVRTVTNTCEDNFIRHLYRTIENIIKHGVK